MLKIEWTNQFKRDYKLAKRRKKDMALLHYVIETIEHEKILDKKFLDHALGGNWKTYRELHLEPDWLLIYKIKAKTFILTRTGTHADLFR